MKDRRFHAKRLRVEQSQALPHFSFYSTGRFSPLSTVKKQFLYQFILTKSNAFCIMYTKYFTKFEMFFMEVAPMG